MGAFGLGSGAIGFSAAGGGGLKSPVTLDPLTFSGAVTFSKNLTISTTGSTTGAPRTFGCAAIGPGEAFRFQSDGPAEGWQAGYAQRNQLYSYWGMELRGHTEFNGPPSFVTQTATDPAVSVINTLPAIKALVVKGAASQSGNLLDLQDSSGAAVGFFDSGGRFYFGSSTSAGSINGTTNQVNLWGDVVVQNGQLSVNGAAGIKWSNAGSNQLTVGAAGGASAPPATPTKYLKVQDSTGASLVIPAYAAS